MQLAKSLARDLVRVEREKKIENRRLELARQRQAHRESFESLGRVVRNVQNAYMEGFVKPLNNALKSMRRGYRS